MNTFKLFLILEFKRLFISKRNWIVMGIFLLLCLFLVQVGIQQYMDMENRKETFREFERKKVEQIVNWDQYGLYGFRLFFLPCPLSTLFYNSGHFTELMCRIDSGETLYIYSLLEGKKIFEEKQGKLMDFSGIVLLLGSIFSLLYGFDAFRHREYIKFLSSLYGHRQTFFYIWLSRVILWCEFFICVTLFAWLLLVIHENEIKSGGLTHFLAFFLVMLMIQVFFFTVGTIAGNIKSRLMGGAFIILTWMLSVYFIPASLNKIVEAKAGKMPSYYHVESDKLEILMTLERKERYIYTKLTKPLILLGTVYKDLIEKKITNSNDFWERIAEEKRREAITEGEMEILEEIDELREKNSSFEEINKKINEIYGKLYREWEEWKKNQPIRAMGYLKKEFIEIEKKEKELLTQMKSDVDFFQYLFSNFPTTFYLSTGNEVCSRGYANIITFYENAIGIKKEFMEFYLAHRYGPNPVKIVNFIEEYLEKYKDNREANIFHATSRLPGKFGLGVGITMLWILLAEIFSYLFYKKALFLQPQKQISELGDLAIDVEKGKANVVLSNSKEIISSHLYNVLSGKNREIIGTISWDGVNIGTGKIKHDFVYLCQPEEIPQDIKADHFVSFFRRTLKLSHKQFKDLSSRLNLKEIKRKNFSELKDHEKGLILLETALLRKCNIYMFYEFAKGMPSDFIRRFTNRLQELKDDGASIIYITNDVFMGRKIADYISFLKKEAALMTSDF